MYWFTRPPYVRWGIAAAIVAAAFAVELRPTPTDQYPFLANDVAAGDRLSPDDIEWRDLPAGLFAIPLLNEPNAARALVAGEPLLDSSLTNRSLVPEGWWAVPIELPVEVVQGTVIRVVVLDPPLIVDGIVVRSQVRDTFAASEPALVAVPAAAADIVAAASATNAVTILMRP